jgi:catechol-2,3-dioxygenase
MATATLTNGTVPAAGASGHPDWYASALALIIGRIRLPVATLARVEEFFASPEKRTAL